MSGFAARSRALALALAALAGAGASSAAAQEAPRRVVSVNACTDQLAMLIADEDQLRSVSWLAADPRVSAMAADAAAFPLNRGRAEEVFLLRPDLVIAGAYTGRASADMLRRLGVRVETFEPAARLEDVAAHLRRMGELLGRTERAEAIAADFEVRLARLRTEIERRPRAALYYANGYTAGDRSLAGQILVAAGLSNVASGAGFPDGGTMPLELLVTAAPDLLVEGEPYPGASRAEAILEHPALSALRGAERGRLADSDWTCGTPFVLRAVDELARVRDGLSGSAP